MNWLTAGMLQGAGQGLSAAGAEVSKAAITATLEQQRQTMEDARAKRNLDVQQKMHTETLTAGKENLASSQVHAESMQGRTFQHAEGQAADTRAHAEKMQQSGFTHTETMAQTSADAAFKNSQAQIDKMVELQKLSSDQAKAFHKDSTALAKASIQAQTNGVGHLQPLADGTIMKVMKDGSTSLLTGADGKPVKGLTDITKTQQIIAEADKALMLHYSAYLEKNQMTMSEDEKRAVQAKIDDLSLSIHNTGKPPMAPFQSFTPKPSGAAAAAPAPAAEAPFSPLEGLPDASTGMLQSPGMTNIPTNQYQQITKPVWQSPDVPNRPLVNVPTNQGR